MSYSVLNYTDVFWRMFLGLNPHPDAGFQTKRISWYNQVPHTRQDLYLPDSSGDKNRFRS